jgi:hypothetical protein
MASNFIYHVDGRLTMAPLVLIKEQPYCSEFIIINSYSKAFTLSFRAAQYNIQYH